MLSRLVRARLVLAALGLIVVAGGVFWAGRATAAQSPSTASQLPLAVGAPATVPAGAVSTGALSTSATATSVQAGYPVWCCSGSPLGLTVTGQATVRGTGQGARSTAIGRAMADAAGQAHAAARAAGISLGKIINVQLSTSSYPYPLPMAGAAQASPGAARSSPAPAPAAGAVTSGGTGTQASGIATPEVACPAGRPCGYRPGTTVTVTVTWSLG